MDADSPCYGRFGHHMNGHSYETFGTSYLNSVAVQKMIFH